ncbi:hypothetical protein, conserved [Babesia bigemina]|uniref:Uncharacterized protein n=1 Tax=Babesia bigemina TaxID=5866 RepID=A0A061DAT0_BABBI|nr:hypothetical protein, conserved [Babesia bigemina]CDR97663.1 hypothetical protein, conserved [Babesia bigemina]|eukprot:XP_012769849.1 hypothetical protein, conserved [Babesia bigemina]
MFIYRLSQNLQFKSPLTAFCRLPPYKHVKSKQWESRCISFWQPVSSAPAKLDSGASNVDLYPKVEGEKSMVTKLWQSIKRVARIEEGDPDEQITEYFQYSVECLMRQPGEFTFDKFATYLEVMQRTSFINVTQEICTKLRLIGKRPIPDEELNGPLRQLKLQRKLAINEMMKFLTPREKESDSATVFSHQAKLLLAESVKVCYTTPADNEMGICPNNSLQCTLKDVDDMLYHHDICKTDRSWYFRRIVLGRHLPMSYEEREHLSYQRPVVREAAQLYPETSSLEALKLKEMRDSIHYRKPP